jgi:hypothetical protein
MIERHVSYEIIGAPSSDSNLRIQLLPSEYKEKESSAKVAELLSLRKKTNLSEKIHSEIMEVLKL